MLRLLDEIMDVKDSKPWHIYLTGHSMGGALATYAAYEIAVGAAVACLLRMLLIRFSPLILEASRIS